LDVCLMDANGQKLSWVVGGETVILSINVAILQTLESPIVGFFVKDRLGQTLFGDNTFLSYQDSPVHCGTDCQLNARFVFDMPLLPAGDYSFTIAIADGSQLQHEQHEWMHDALLFKSESTSGVSGLIGIPMQDIQLQTLETEK